MMPLFIRAMTGVIVIGGVAGVVFANSFLVAFIIGLWTLGLAYIGLAFAAYWQDL